MHTYAPACSIKAMRAYPGHGHWKKKNFFLLIFTAQKKSKPEKKENKKKKFHCNFVSRAAISRTSFNLY